MRLIIQVVRKISLKSNICCLFIRIITLYCTVQLLTATAIIENLVISTLITSFMYLCPCAYKKNLRFQRGFESRHFELGEAPGFLIQWWSVFWDLYCAAPERRENCEHSKEAKVFHDFVSLSIINIFYFINIFFNYFDTFYNIQRIAFALHSRNWDKQFFIQRLVKIQSLFGIYLSINDNNSSHHSLHTSHNRKIQSGDFISKLSIQDRIQ